MDEKVNETAEPAKAEMSVQEYADYRGVSSAAVYKRIREGAFNRNTDGLINVEHADANYYSRSNRIRMTGTRASEAGIGEAGADGISDQMKLIRERAKKEALAAEREEINLAKLKNTVVDKLAVESLVFTIAKQNSSAWLNWSNAISVELASELGVDPSLFHSLLKREVEKHLRDTATLRFDIDSLEVS